MRRLSVATSALLGPANATKIDMCLPNFVFGRSFAPLGVFRKQRRVAYFEAPDRLPI